MSPDFAPNLCSTDISRAALADSRPLIVILYDNKIRYSEEPAAFWPEGLQADDRDTGEALGPIFVCDLQKQKEHVDEGECVALECAIGPLSGSRALSSTNTAACNAREPQALA